MTDENKSITPFLLGRTRAEPSRNLLMGNGTRVRLEPRVMDVLGVLAEHAGEVVSRDTLITGLWPSEFGADESLTRAVSLIRKALRQTGEGADAIETIKKRGYRLRLPVAPLDDPTGNGQEHADEPVVVQAGNAGAGTATRKASMLAPFAAASILLILSAVWLVTTGHDSAREDGDPAAAGASVAVLAFEALSDNDSDSYLGAGIAEEILNALARFPDLQVIARTSAFAVDRNALSLSDIASQLDVEHLVTGSVRRSGQRLRITAQLIRSADGVTVWSNSYDVEQDDLLTTEDEIVLDVANTLQARLGVGAAASRSDGAGIDPLAYEQYLQGLRWFGDRMHRDGNRERALAAFQRAVAFEPDFADAWAGIGAVGTFSVGSPLSRDREAFQAMTEHALERAIALDPDNSTAHAVLAIFSAAQRVDIEAARSHLSQAEAAAPNAALTHYATALIHRILGDWDDALAAFDRTIALDPLNAVIKRVRAELLIEMGRFDEGMAFFEDCFVTKCLSEGFIVFASTAAVFTQEQHHIERWLPRLDAFHARIAEIPENRKPIVARIMPAFFSIRLQRRDAEAMTRLVRQLFEEQLITDTPGIWAPTFARVLGQDIVLDVLHRAYERGDLFSAAFAFAAMSGVDPYPDWLLGHPRYHELWQRPGMPALAASLRANGHTAGLPR